MSELILVMYNEDQDVIRLYDCFWECWVDMKDIYVGEKFKDRITSLTQLISWGWNLVGEL
jgi:hypothetical protein